MCHDTWVEVRGQPPTTLFETESVFLCVRLAPSFRGFTCLHPYLSVGVIRDVQA